MVRVPTSAHASPLLSPISADGDVGVYLLRGEKKVFLQWKQKKKNRLLFARDTSQGKMAEGPFLSQIGHFDPNLR